MLIAAAFLVLQVFTTAFIAFRRAGGEQEAIGILQGATQDGFVFAMATFATTLVLVPALFGIAALKKGSDVREYFALQPVRTRVLAGWAGITLGLLALSDGLTYLAGKPVVPQFMARAYENADPLWPFWLALVVAAPLFEETFFRGFLYRGFKASVLGVPGAIGLTALLWAAIHLQYDWYGIATIFVLGVVFGLARERTGSIFVPLGLHAMTNFIATAEAALLR